MLQDKGFSAVHGGILVIHRHLVVAEDDVVCRYGVNQRHTMGDERIVLNEDVLMVALLLGGGDFYLRVDGDNALRELVAADEVVLKEVIADDDVAATPAFVPALRIAGQQDGRAAAADELVTLYHHRLRRGEERSAGSIGSHDVV